MPYWLLRQTKIAGTRNTMLSFLGEEAILSEAHVQRYGYGSEPVCGDAGDILKNIIREKQIEQKWKAESFVLYKSTLTPQGPVYEPIAVFKNN